MLDTAYLQRLAAHLGRDTVLELLADGLIELTDRLNELDRLAATGDVSGMMRLSHDITGVAGHLGLAALSATAAQMNRDLRAAPLSDPRVCAVQVRRAGDPALSALGAAMHDGGWHRDS